MDEVTESEEETKKPTKGFSDYNKSWLKPKSKKAAKHETSSSDEEMEEDQEVIYYYLFFHMNDCISKKLLFLGF